MHACYGLGVSHEIGVGVDRDAAQAATFFRKACDRGHKQACLRAP